MHPPESAIIRHPFPIQTHKPRILQKQPRQSTPHQSLALPLYMDLIENNAPKEVSGHILFSPKRATPLSSLVRNLFSKIVVISLAIQTPTEEDVCVI